MANQRNKHGNKIGKKKLILTLLFVVFALLAFLAVTRTKESPRATETEAAPRKVIFIPGPVQAASNQYSDEEIHAFWNAHLNRLIAEELVEHKYPLAEIQQEYNNLCDRSMRRYGRLPDVNLSNKFNKFSEEVIAGVNTEGPTPKVIINVPAVMNAYKQLHDSHNPNWEKQFEVLVISSFLHEMEHIAGDWIYNGGDRKKFLSNESAAWAETCSNVLRIYVDHGYALPPPAQIVYNAWDTCERKNNPCWQDFITSYHAGIKNE